MKYKVAMFVKPLLLAILLDYTGSISQATSNTAITIGAIANGNPTMNKTVVSDFGYDINAVWHYIDIAEVFQIFSSIRILDEQSDIDVIMLFDYDPFLLKMPQILDSNKPLIKWGEKIQEPITVTEGSGKFYLHDGDICGDEVISSMLYDDPYCMTDLNTSNLYGSQTNDSLTVTAPRALTKLVEKLTWRKVFIIHENATEREAAELSDSMSNIDVLFVIYNVDRIPDFHNTLLEIYDATVRFKPEINFVVLCRFHCARKIFRKANHFDSQSNNNKTLIKQFSKWLVAVYGHSKGVSRALQACANDLDNVVIIGIPEFNGAGSQDLHDLLLEMLKNIKRMEMDSAMTHDALKEHCINVLTEKAAIWNPAAKCKGYNIDTLLWTDKGHRGFSSVGYVEIAGHVVVQNDLFPNTKYGYNKRHFLVSTLPYKPFVDKIVINGTVSYQGFCIDLLDELARTLNFTYNLTEPEDQLWGSLIDEDSLTFNGLIGQLQSKKCDMVAAPISIQTNREGAVDFAYPFYYDYTTVVMKKPDINSKKWRTLIDPFKWEVLLSIGLALPVVTILAFLIEKYNPYYDQAKHAEERKQNGGLHYMHNAFWYMYGALLCQGGVHLPDSIAGRTFVSCWWLFCIIVVGTYSGNLIAFLTVTKEKPPFNSLSEMVEMKDSYTWGTLGGTAWEVIFMTSSTAIYKKVWDGLRQFNKSDPAVLSTNSSYHIERVMAGGYAWIGDKTFIEVSMAKHCGLIKTKQEFLPMKYAFAFTNYSPHTTIFSDQMIKIHEGGLLQIWKRKWWPKANFCKSDTVTESKPITLIDVQSAFFVCVAGIFLGTVAFICELSVFHYRKYKIRKKTNEADKTNGRRVVNNHTPARKQNDTQQTNLHKNTNNQT